MIREASTGFPHRKTPAAFARRSCSTQDIRSCSASTWSDHDPAGDRRQGPHLVGPEVVASESVSRPGNARYLRPFAALASTRV